MENYKKELPQEYKEVYHINAKSAKVGVLMTLACIAIMLVVLVPALLIADWSCILDFTEPYGLIVIFATLIIYVAYIVLHELTHGVAYKALTHQKLTFGLTLTVAFCGVPDIYVSRKTALISLAAPLVTFTIVFLPLTIWLYFVDTLMYICSAFLFASHLGGCCGDIFMLLLLGFKYKDKELLMRDTGPEQFIYLPEKNLI